MRLYEYGYEPTKEKNKVTQKATLQESRLRNSQISPSLGNNNNRTLYLTIADHYKWDA